MPNMDRFKYEQGMKAIRNSSLDDESKYNAMYELEKEFNRQEYIRKHNDLLARKMAPNNSSSGCLIVMGFMTIFAGLAGVTVAKTVSNVLDVKPSQSVTQPCEKPTLVSKNKVISPKDLGNEHLKN